MSGSLEGQARHLLITDSGKHAAHGESREPARCAVLHRQPREGSSGSEWVDR
jgi:hypothetical protein